MKVPDLKSAAYSNAWSALLILSGMADCAHTLGVDDAGQWQSLYHLLPATSLPEQVGLFLLYWFMFYCFKN